MRRSRLLDLGSEFLTYWPEIETTDGRGQPGRGPDLGNPITIRVSVSTDRQSDAELPGYVSNRVLRVLTRDSPGATSWARVEFRGEYWDLATPPVFSNFTKASRHWEFVIRSRNMIVKGG